MKKCTNKKIIVLLLSCLLFGFWGAKEAFAVAPVINAVSDNSIMRGNAYQYTPSLSAGSSVHWSKAYGPDDMTVDPSTGAVSWAVPATLSGEAFYIGVKATNFDGSDTETWILLIKQSGSESFIYVKATEGDYTTTKDAMINSSAGDCIVIEDGTYTSQNMMIRGGSAGAGYKAPANGTSDHYTTIMAQTPLGVIFDSLWSERKAISLYGSDWSGSNANGAEYIAIKGFVSHSGRESAILITHSNHIKVTDSAFYDGYSIGNNSTATISYSSYVLIENCFAWGSGRYKFLVFQSDHVILRRCVARVDYHNANNQPIGVFTSYGSDNVEMQNCIAIDNDSSDYWLNVSANGANQQGLFGVSETKKSLTGNSRNQITRCIGLNSEMKFTQSDTAAIHTVEEAYFTDCVGWKFRSLIAGNPPNGLPFSGWKAKVVNVNNCTFGDLGLKTGTDYPDYWFNGWSSLGANNNIVTNSIFHNANSSAGLFYLIEDANYNNIFNSGASSNSTINNTISTDPTSNGLKYLTRIESGSSLSTAGNGGVRVGADLTKMYGKSGTLWGETGYNSDTIVDMWPFPNEDQIRNFMRSYNPDGTDPTKPDGKRGFCADSQTLTNYIWGYLGNTVPPFNPRLKVWPERDKATLYWTPHTEGDLDFYKVYVGSASGTYDFPGYIGGKDVGNNISHTITGLNPNLSYYIVVTAVDDGARESGYSEEVIFEKIGIDPVSSTNNSSLTITGTRKDNETVNVTGAVVSNYQEPTIQTWSCDLSFPSTGEYTINVSLPGGSFAVEKIDYDTVAPQLTSPPTETSITNTSAIIDYSTDEPGTGVVYFGTVTGTWNSVDADIKILEFEAGTYVDAVAGDLNDTVTGATSGHTGTLIAYDNTLRKWWVRVAGINTFTVAENVNAVVTGHGQNVTISDGTTLSVNGTPWTANVYDNKKVNPDTTQKNIYSIVSNTADSIVISGDITGIAQSSDTFAVYEYKGATVEITEAVNAGLTSNGLQDAENIWTANEFAGLEINPDISQNHTFNILSNTLTAITTDTDYGAMTSVMSSEETETSDDPGGIDEYILTDTDKAAPWDTDQFVGMVLVPNDTSSDDDRAYMIIANTGSTITTEPADGSMLAVAAAGNPYKIRPIYEIYRTGHSIELEFLSDSTTYYYQVTSVDGAANNDATSSTDNNPSIVKSFTTKSVADTTDPLIVGAPTVTAVTNTTATIDWTTDEPADSRVHFRTTANSTITGLNWDEPDGGHDQLVDTNASWTDDQLIGLWLHPDKDNAAISTIFPITTNTETIITISGDMSVPAQVADTYCFVKRSATLTQNHSVTLSGLQSDTSYTIFVGSRDGSNNFSAASSEVSFTTTNTSDSTAPQILSPPTVTSKTDTTAVVEWTTDEAGTSTVEYGGSSFYSNTQALTSYVTDHSVTLTGLVADTTYHFRVSSTDNSGNGPDTSGTDSNPSNDNTFTTAPTPDTQAPQFTSPPTANVDSNTQVTITWQTDEDSNSQVHYDLVSAGSQAWGNYASSKNDGSMVTTHSVTVTGLLAGTAYYFRVGSDDAAQNGPATSNEFTFTTAGAADETAPQFTAPPTVTIDSDTKVTITWQTDEDSNSLVQYGLVSTGSQAWGNYASSKNDGSMVNSHSITITGLAASTAYYYRVGSYDAAQNGPTTSNEFSFTTAATSDTTAPQFTSPPTVNIDSDTQVTITWQTDEDSNSLVKYGLQSAGSKTWENYASSQNNGSMVNSHSITLTGLTDSTAYYFRVGSDDAAQNGPTTSNQFSFTTAAASDTTAPQFTGSPTVTIDSDTQVTITWQTDEDSNSQVRYDPVPRASWGGGYVSSRSDGSMVTSHSVVLTGLAASTKYYFRAGSDDAANNGPTTSNEFSFTTAAAPDETAPQLTAPPSANVQSDSTVIIEWQTDEESNSLVRYDPASRATWDGGYVSSRSDGSMVTSHSVTITGLTGNTQYYFCVGSDDAANNGPTTSNEFSFTTAIAPDTTAPLVISGPTATVQSDTAVVITWQTDEDSNSLVQYGLQSEGSQTWGNYALSKNDGSMVTNHSVTITGLADDTAHYFRVGSIDAAGNGPVVNSNSTNASAEGPFTTDDGPDEDVPLITSGPTATVLSDTSAVIKWQTNEASNSLVRYDPASRGTWGGGYVSSQNDGTMVTSHSVTITGLTESTLYYFRVGSDDVANNGPTTSSESSFTTDAWPDEDAPLITSGPTVPGASLTHNIAVIEWTTDELSNSSVQYGPASVGSKTWGNYAASKSIGAMTTSHSITITGLNSSTQYYFRVGSDDLPGNGPTTSSEGAFTTDEPPDTDPPSIVQYPSISHSNDTIDVVYDESNMQGANVETNYSFSPSLNFTTLGGNDDIVNISGSTYRFYMVSIPDYTVLTLTVSNITDEWGNAVSPVSITINDDDNDGLADDWETDYGVTDPAGDDDSDGMPNSYELDNVLDPTVNDADQDADGDNWTNYEEYINGTDANNSSSSPTSASPRVIEVIPHNNAGISDSTRIANNASFFVRIEDDNGIDLTTESSVTFSIDDGDNAVYSRNLDDTTTIRSIKLTQDSENQVTKLWGAYDREEDIYGTYSYDATISITVDVTDRRGDSMQVSYDFKIESQAEHDDAQDPANLPDTGDVDPGDAEIGGSYTAGVEVNSGSLEGARIIYALGDPVTPVFGPVNEMPAFNAAGATGVGVAMNLQPPTVFNTPPKIFIPCPGVTDVSVLNIYYYNGTSWVLACNAAGTVQSGGEGWMVPNTRDNHNSDSPPTIEIQVYHFSGAQAGKAIPGSSSPISSGTAGGGGGGGGGCFIATAAFGSPLESHVVTLYRFRDRYLMKSYFGQKFVDSYYQYSPDIADYLRENENARTAVRWALIPVAWVSLLSLYIHPFILMFGFMLMVILFGNIKGLRHRGKGLKA